MAQPLVTVIIPNYNGRAWLPSLMQSLAVQTNSRFAATVVDDASTDGSVGYLRSRWPNVRVIANAENRGFAATCNRGLCAAATPFVALLNNDTHLDANWLAEGLRPFDAPDVGAVASLVLLAEPPHLIDSAGDIYSVAGGAVKRNHLRPRETAAGLGSEVFSACGASAFYRREAIAAAGWLDERLESYYEDVDLGFRIAWLGYRCVFSPTSICYHHLSMSYDPQGWRYHFNSARNAEIVWWSAMPPRLRRRHILAHLGFLIAQSANKLRQGCILPYLAGKWSVLRHVAHIREKRAQHARIAQATDAHIDSLLVRDWWKLHVGSRLSGNASQDCGTGVPPVDHHGPEARATGGSGTGSKRGAGDAAE
ncbi:MAG: glycosyltransferase family 2 protein [Phycisphaerae bacterium]|nr:glycosyltransferase family 2 protein [Phycisphaerae bacterium]